jgi:small-conductance mechanosensitive channel
MGKYLVPNVWEGYFSPRRIIVMGGPEMVKLFDMFDVDLPDYLNNQWAEFLILLGVWLLIGLLVMMAMRLLARLTFAKTETKVDDLIVEAISGPVVLLVFGYGVIESLRVLDIVSGELVDRVLGIYEVLVALIVVYLAYKIFRLVFIPMAQGVSKKRKQTFNKTVYDLFESVGAVIILVFGFFWVLTVLGLNVTVFLAGAGIAGLILAFAMQDTLSNYFSGLHLMLDKPFEIGDTIEINDEFMKVLRVGMRSTRLYNMFAHEIEIVPNNMIANSMISNVTQPDSEYRAFVKVGVAYGSDLAKVKKIILEVVTSNDDVVTNDDDRRPSCNLIDFGESTLVFRTRFFVKDVLKQWRVKGAVRENIDQRFREEGITIPFPQRTLSILPPESDEVLQVRTSQPIGATVPSSD